MMGIRWRIAISCARRIFLIVSGHHEPAFTVASLATTTTGRPPMAPAPVTTPAAGAWPSYWSYATSRPTSSHGPSASSNAATRSRAVSFPCSCCRRSFSGPPPCSSRVCSARYSAVRVARRDDVGAATGGGAAAGCRELRGDMVSRPLLEVLHELGGRRPGAEELADALTPECGHVVGGDDAAARDQDLVPPGLSEQLLHPREQRHVRPGENRQPDDVRVFLDRRLGDLLGRLVQAGVDHFHSSVAQSGGDDLGDAVVAVEPGLRHEHPNRALEPPGASAGGSVWHQRRKRNNAARPFTARRARSSYSTSTCARCVSASSIASSIAWSSARPSTTSVRTCPRSRALRVGATPFSAQPVDTPSRTASAWVRSQTRSRSSRRLSAASRTWAAVTLFGLSFATPSTRSWR